jgi:estrogen-related receptor beta like 1
LDGEEEEEEVLYTEMLHVAPETNGLDESQKAILESNLDPLLWQTELERVGPRLKVSAQGDTGKEWRGHIEQTRKHEMVSTTNYLKTYSKILWAPRIQLFVD